MLSSVYHLSSPLPTELQNCKKCGLLQNIDCLFTIQSRLLTTLKQRAFENIGEKQKMLQTSIFSFFHDVFYLSQINLNISFTFILLSANAFNMDQSKTLSFGEDFTNLSDWVICCFQLFVYHSYHNDNLLVHKRLQPLFINFSKLYLQSCSEFTNVMEFLTM